MRLRWQAITPTPTSFTRAVGTLMLTCALASILRLLRAAAALPALHRWQATTRMQTSCMRAAGIWMVLMVPTRMMEEMPLMMMTTTLVERR